MSWVAWLPYVLSNSGLGIWDIDFPALLGTTQFAGVLPRAYLSPILSAYIVTRVADGKEGVRRWVVEGLDVRRGVRGADRHPAGAGLAHPGVGGPPPR